MTDIADDAPIRLDVAAKLAGKVAAEAAKHGLDGPAFKGDESLEKLSNRLTWLRLLALRYAAKTRQIDRPLLAMVAKHVPLIEARIAELRTPPPEKTAEDYAVGTVYVAGYGPYVKIGFTSRPVTVRVAGLQTPQPVHIYATFPNATRKLERELHARFAHQRLNGEWFHRSADVAKWMKRKCPL